MTDKTFKILGCLIFIAAGISNILRKGWFFLGDFVPLDGLSYPIGISWVVIGLVLFINTLRKN